MKVTAREVLGAWVELDREAPYHTEQKPIGMDRKRVEGPLPTNEQFENTWLPTQKDVEAEPCDVSQVEVVQIEVAGMKKRADMDPDPIPGVPAPLFRAWEQAHDAEVEFVADQTLASLDKFTHFLVAFANEVGRIGLVISPQDIDRLKNYTFQHRPDNGDEYSIPRANEIIQTLDTVLGRLHDQAVRLTGVPKEVWYEYQADRMKEVQHFNTPVMNVTPEEEKELGLKPRPFLAPDELRKRRGPMAPFYEDIWQRKKKHELTGMKIRAVDVKRPRKKVKEQPAQEVEPDSFDQAIDQTVQELDAPKKAPRPHPAVLETNQMANGAPDILAKTIGEAGDWLPQDEMEGVQGAVFSYEKYIQLDDPDDDNLSLRIYAFVEPFTTRKKRLYDQAKSSDSYRGRGAGDAIRQEADNMPDTGYINDIEVFYEGGMGMSDGLLFHRERAFTPQKSLSSREFMAGDSMQRAITDLQNFVRTQIDPIPVGQFIENALRNPGKGEAKLSHRTFNLFQEKTSMKINAADVLDFDPSRRKLKTPPAPPAPRMGPRRVEPAAMDMGEPAEGMDYESLLMLYDSTVAGLKDMEEAFIATQPTLHPDQQKEAGHIIAKLRAAMRALSA